MASLSNIVCKAREGGLTTGKEERWEEIRREWIQIVNVHNMACKLKVNAAACCTRYGTYVNLTKLAGRK